MERVEKVAGLPPDVACRLRAIAPVGSALSHETAVGFLGLPADRRQEGKPMHITVPVGKNLDRKCFTVHIARLPDDDICDVDTWPVTTPERTFLDVAASMDRERLVVVGDGLLARQLTTADALHERLALAHRVRGVRLARQTVPLLDGRAQSPPESILRLRFQNAGLPAPELQFRIRLGDYDVHPDFVWPKARTVLEYEGRQHAEPDQFALDIDRYSELAARGWLVLRASNQDLAGRSDRLIRRVGAALHHRGLRW
jgi:very-short-patch-repair endonuclease